MPITLTRTGKFVLIALCALTCFAGVLAIGLDPSLYFPTGSQSEGKIRPDDIVHRVWNSGLYADPERGRQIFWVDDSTILFRANKDPKPRTNLEAQAREELLYLWRLGEKPKTHGVNPREAAATYCAARGNVSYHQNIVDPLTGAKKRTRWLGPPGQEREVPPWKVPPGGDPVNNRQLIPPSDCELYSDLAMTGFDYVTDPDRRFYIVLGARPNPLRPELKEQLVLRRVDGTTRVSLPIARHENAVQYDVSNGTFLVYRRVIVDSDSGPFPNDFDEWRKSNCWPIWRIDPETAKVEQKCIPYGAWIGDPPPSKRSGATVNLIPTKAGFFISYSRLRGVSGLYKLEDGSVRNIFGGEAVDPVISPNGCRVAFTYFPNYDVYKLGSPVFSTVVAIDVCSQNQ